MHTHTHTQMHVLSQIHTRTDQEIMKTERGWGEREREKERSCKHI